MEYDYEAEQPDELSIKVGQTIKNVLTEDGGWWEGELDGKKGMFPDNFVKVMLKMWTESLRPTFLLWSFFIVFLFFIFSYNYM